MVGGERECVDRQVSCLLDDRLAVPALCHLGDSVEVDPLRVQQQQVAERRQADRMVTERGVVAGVQEGGRTTERRKPTSGHIEPSGLGEEIVEIYSEAECTVDECPVEVDLATVYSNGGLPSELVIEAGT